MTVSKADKTNGVSAASLDGWRWVVGEDEELLIKGSERSCTYSQKDIIEIPAETLPLATRPEDARQKVMEMVLASELSADEITAILSIYRTWVVGESLEVDDLRTYDGNLYKVNQAHTTQAGWTPDNTPVLFTNVAPAGVIPDWVQPTGGHDAYNTGDQVQFEGAVYESLINANVWSPTAYPAGWVLVE